MKKATVSTGIRITEEQRTTAEAIAAATGAARAGVLRRAVTLGLEQLVRQVQITK
jgi:hypothetical protein